MSIQQNPTETKLVQVHLSALIRVELTQIVEVPADINKTELNELVNKMWDAADGSEFVSDPKYFERGECYTSACNPAGEIATVVASRSDGRLRIEAAGPASQPTAAAI